MQNTDVKLDCRYYRGDIPCKPHKNTGVHCNNCSSYQKTDKRILIIKLGAAGDVVRTTGILPELRQLFPQSHITWLTDFPECVPASYVDQILRLDTRSTLWLQTQNFDYLYCLDKDKEAIALEKLISAKIRFGYSMDEFGHAKGLNKAASDKIMTGIFDDIGKNNQKSYPQEIFEICELPYRKQGFVVDKMTTPHNQILNTFKSNKKIVGLNTGCGSRWPSRLWPEEHWIALAKKLLDNNYEVLWLGGPEEHQKNSSLKQKAGGVYLGTFSLPDFILLLDKCDSVVTQVTMALHLALGLKKKVVLMNNIFNRHEFELFGLGKIVEPENPSCLCYFNPVCDRPCMSRILPDRIYETLLSL